MFHTQGPLKNTCHLLAILSSRTEENKPNQNVLDEKKSVKFRQMWPSKEDTKSDQPDVQLSTSEKTEIGNVRQVAIGCSYARGVCTTVDLVIGVLLLFVLEFIICGLLLIVLEFIILIVFSVIVDLLLIVLEFIILMVFSVIVGLLLIALKFIILMVFSVIVGPLLILLKFIMLMIFSVFVDLLVFRFEVYHAVTMDL
ncbi:hypothetical protein OROGR_028339 [Orobanche gracilis]